MTARPPSLRSCADTDSAFAASVDEAIDERSSAARSIAGGTPRDDIRELSWRIRRKKIRDDGFMRFAPLRHRMRRAIEEQDRIAFVAKGRAERMVRIFENAEDAENRRGINRVAESFVVEADVAAGDGNVESAWQASEMPSIASLNWRITSGFSGLPKFRQFVAATGARLSRRRCGRLRRRRASRRDAD